MKKNDTDKLTKKERLFCRCYVSCGNAGQAAEKAGFPFEQTGEELLCREDIMREVGRLFRRKKTIRNDRAMCGYERIAFANSADAVKLLFMEDPCAREIEKLDLFNVAEIKKPKDGAMEIKFFDRLRALEKLSGGQNGEEDAVPFYLALERGARALEENKGGVQKK